MAISNDEVKHIAALARLTLTSEEIERYRKQLDSILLYMNKLNQVDTTNIEPTSHAVEMTSIHRDDAVKPSLTQTEALENAPDKTDKFYRVPKIIE
ncbi:Glu-tRNAGln amidotransferase, C subunit [Candidatus Magnetoovum chiemensis]|nr:Glu-tRNAGln amidotransferase, C subunit [Candidatus Magnetoovum chiemensis]